MNDSHFNSSLFNEALFNDPEAIVMFTDRHPVLIDNRTIDGASWINDRTVDGATWIDNRTIDLG